MPHAVNVPSSGLQAIILCGPGASFSTFTAHPEDHPKALLPIANRPMVWYPLDWCYRMGISEIHLITPPSSKTALESALSQNPHLTSLPLPRASIISPKDLTQTSGTAEILRLPEVYEVIEGDFMVLPCDLICGLPGETLIEAWMIENAKFDMFDVGIEENFGEVPNKNVLATAAGGLGVWYQTKGKTGTKAEETDFIITAPNRPPAISLPLGSIRNHIQHLVYCSTRDTLNDITEEKNAFPVRNSLLRKHGKVRILNTYRDSHIYLFPHWVLEMIQRNANLENISEDVVGNWAKATWQDGLIDKLGVRTLLSDPSLGKEDAPNIMKHHVGTAATSFSTTSSSTDMVTLSVHSPSQTQQFPRKNEEEVLRHSPSIHQQIPLMLAYVQPTDVKQALVRRVDTASLLLDVSLALAKLDSVDEVGKEASSPFAHQQKVAKQAAIAQRTTVTRTDCLVAENVTIEERCVIKETVVGARCMIKSGARLTRCVLMDGAVVEEQCQLTGCILGFNSKIGRESQLRDCEVQEGNSVPERTDSKGENFMIFEGLDDGEEDVDEQQEGDEMMLDGNMSSP